MVFSFFTNKPPEKMPERQAAKPKAPEPPVGQKPVGTPAEPAANLAATPAASKPRPASGRDSAPEAFRDSMFGEEFTLANVMDIEVEHDVDPVQIDIEQAAVLFANGQDAAARAVLENAARGHTGAAAERLWRMLFDLLQVLGDRPAFDKLGMEFAQVCEQSPPTWRHEAPAAPKAAANSATILLQGVIAGNDSPGFAKLREAVDKKQATQLNLGKLVGLDDLAAGTLFELLRKARKLGLNITLEGADGLIGRLQQRLNVGQPGYEKGWILLLEFYQLLGLQELFDEKAIDYAVTFEVSPPSWEAIKAGTVKSVAAPALQLAAMDETYTLSGECKNNRFEDLQSFLALHDRPIIDCAYLKRLDFPSAGMLRNILSPHQQKGKEIVIRHPHHLVAELLNIVGVSSVAKIVVTKF